MNKRDLRQMVQEQLQVVFQEGKEMSTELSKSEVELVDDILGDDMLEEGSFAKLREKFNKVLKSGAMTLGVLAAVLGNPDMAQAQKAELKKDVTDSTWFLDQKDFLQNDKRVWSGFQGDYVNNSDYDQDLDDTRERGTDAIYSVEKWVNNLGQDSTVYKQYQDSKYKYFEDGNSGYEYSNPGDPVKTVVNKDVKPWAGKDWTQLTKKGNIGNYLWSKDKTKSITPEVHKELKKLEKGKKVNYRDGKSVQAKQYQDDGISSSDFEKVDLKNIQSPSS